MELERINPELRKAYRRIPNLRMDKPWVLRLTRWLMKWQKGVRSAEGVSIVDHQLGVAGVRVYEPDNRTAQAALLWIHGGGMIIGSNIINDNECIRYARELGILVASVEYRLAPEHPFPAPLDDCFTVWQWLQDNAAQLGIDPARIVISGQSAGGGLSASLVQRIHDSGGVQPAGQALHCPMLDDRTALRTELDPVMHKLWNNLSNRAAWAHYLGQPAGEPAVPDYSVPARRESLAGLPETWIGIGGADIFLDEAGVYRDRLEAAGVPCEFHLASGGFHGFEAVAAGTEVLKGLYDSNDAFLRRTLDLS
jgi:acetyl esterase/lipase